MSDDIVERTQNATQIFRQIQALARSDYGGNTNALLVVYAVEGFLRRLATSPYADKMILRTCFRMKGCLGGRRSLPVGVVDYRGCWRCHHGLRWMTVCGLRFSRCCLWSSVAGVIRGASVWTIELR